jgi:hypothetical protein
LIMTAVRDPPGGKNIYVKIKFIEISAIDNSVIRKRITNGASGIN